MTTMLDEDQPIPGTEVPEPPGTPPVRGGRLAAAARAAGRNSRRPAARKATPRKAPQSRTAKAAARGKYADTIVPLAKLGASALFSDPVQQEIVEQVVTPWAQSLDRLAAADTRVDALLQRFSGVAASGGAWTDFGMHTLMAGGAFAVAAGRAPGGPVGALLAVAVGQTVQAAEQAVAQRLAEEHATATGGAVTPELVHSFRVDLILAREQRAADRAAKRKAKKPTETTEAAPAADVPDEGTSTFAPWAP